MCILQSFGAQAWIVFVSCMHPQFATYLFFALYHLKSNTTIERTSVWAFSQFTINFLQQLVGYNVLFGLM